MPEQSLESLIRLALIQCVDEHWKKYHRALTLAALGNQMKSKGFDLKTFLNGKKLASFIHAELSSDLHVAADPDDAGTLAVMPKAQQSNKEAFRGVVTKDTGAAPVPRYPRSVWQAFTRPLAEGSTRIVTLRPSFHYFDANDETTRDAAITGTYAVGPDDVALRQPGEDPGQFATRVNGKIIAWHEKQGLSIAGSHLQMTQDSSRGGAGGSHATALDRLLDALSREQLMRVSLPLDVVDALRKG